MTTLEQHAASIDETIAEQLAGVDRLVSAWRALVDDPGAVPPAIAALLPAEVQPPATLRDAIEHGELPVGGRIEYGDGPSRPVSVRISEDLDQWLRGEAERRGVTVTAIVKEALRESGLLVAEADAAAVDAAAAQRRKLDGDAMAETAAAALAEHDEAAASAGDEVAASAAEAPAEPQPGAEQGPDQAQGPDVDDGAQGRGRRVASFPPGTNSAAIGEQHRINLLAVLKSQPGEYIGSGVAARTVGCHPDTARSAFRQFAADPELGVKHNGKGGAHSKWAYVGEVPAPPVDEQPAPDPGPPAPPTQPEPAPPPSGDVVHTPPPPGPPPPAQPHGRATTRTGHVPRPLPMSGRTRRALEDDAAAAKAGPDQFEGRATAELVEMCEQRGIPVDEGTPDEDMRKALRAKVKQDHAAAAAQKAAQTRSEGQRAAQLDNEILRAMNGESVGGRELAKMLVRNWVEVHERLVALERAGQVASVGDGQWMKVGR